MSQEQLAAFAASVQDNQELQDEVRQMGQDMAGIVAVGEREGYAFTEAELAEYMATYQQESGRELSDEELGAVAGAGWTDSYSCDDSCIY